MSDDNQQQQVSATDVESNSENNDNEDRSPVESLNTTADSSQEIPLQNNNQIQPNTLSGSVGIQDRPRDNTVLTPSFTDSLAPIKPYRNLENSPGFLNVTLKVECKSINGLPSNKAVCDAYTKQPEFIKPKDYSLTLDVTRNGTNYKSVFIGSTEGQSFTIKPGEFDIYGNPDRDPYEAISKVGGFTQFNLVEIKTVTTGDCQSVGPTYTNPLGVFHVKGIIYSLGNVNCSITMEVIHFDFTLPKSSFADMLQSQRIPNVVTQK